MRAAKYQLGKVSHFMVLLSEDFDHLTKGVQDLKPERLGLKLYMNGVYYIIIYSFKPH